jgi:serine/threonine protein phosphatase PrpC
VLFRSPEYASVDTRFESLTRDHTLSSSYLLPASRLNDSVLSRALGVKPSVSIDLSVHPLRAGDVYFLCTDGVHRTLSSDDLRTLIDGASTPAAICSSVMDAVRARLDHQTERQPSWVLATSGVLVIRIG